MNFIGLQEFYSMPTHTLTLIFILTVWSLVWKGFALWKAAKNDQKIWFIIFLVLNTVGLLEILYLFFFSRSKESRNKI